LLSPLFIQQKIWRFFPENTPLFILAMITCFGAMLIRSGPEGFKSILYEGIIIPAGIIWGLQQLYNMRRRFVK
jgi:hypothetical protein